MKSDIIYVGYDSIKLLDINKYLKNIPNIKDNPLIIVTDNYRKNSYLLFTDCDIKQTVMYKFADRNEYSCSNASRYKVYETLNKKHTDVVILSYDNNIVKRTIILANELNLTGSYECYENSLVINDINWDSAKIFPRNFPNEIDWEKMVLDQKKIIAKENNKKELEILGKKTLNKLFKNSRTIFNFNNSALISSNYQLVNVEINLTFDFKVTSINCVIDDSKLYYELFIYDINKKISMVFSFSIFELEDWYTFRITPKK